MSRTHVPADLRRLVRERARDCCEVTLMLLQLSRRERVEERQLLIKAGVLKV